jgi:hypothetical protein
MTNTIGRRYNFGYLGITFCSILVDFAKLKIYREGAKVTFELEDQHEDLVVSLETDNTGTRKEPDLNAKDLEEPNEDLIVLTDSCALLDDQTFDEAVPVHLERGPSGFSFYKLDFVPIQGRPQDDLSPIPVSTAIQEHMISSKSKILLAFVLSKAFWQFYASKWTHSAWDFETVVLLPQKLNYHSLDVEAQTPFLSIRTGSSDTQQSSGIEPSELPRPKKARTIWHPDPQILNLGLLLVLLGTKEGSPGTILQTLNSEYSFCRSQIRDTSNWPHFDSEQIKDEYRRIVQHCIPESRKGISNHPAERRQTLLDKVARPLFDLLQRMHDPIKTERSLEQVGRQANSRPRTTGMSDNR